MAFTTRTEARKVTCPKCQAPPGWACMGVRGEKDRRATLHAERHTAALAAGAAEINVKRRAKSDAVTLEEYQSMDKPPNTWGGEFGNGASRARRRKRRQSTDRIS